MIRIDRGEEPPGLASIRQEEVGRVKAALASGEALSSTLVGDKYAGPNNAFKHRLRKSQRGKCCFCEKWIEASFNDVEHYRPKAQAKGSDGVAREGYWWLAWNWDNLLFACAICNRSAKNSDFPLLDENKRLEPHKSPPGSEEPLLPDPGSEDPIALIEFQQLAGEWVPMPRGGSRRGATAIQLLELRRDDLRDIYQMVSRLDLPPIEKAIVATRGGGQTDDLRVEVDRFLAPERTFLGLRYDMLRSLASDEEWATWLGGLPRPGSA